MLDFDFGGVLTLARTVSEVGINFWKQSSQVFLYVHKIRGEMLDKKKAEEDEEEKEREEDEDDLEENFNDLVKQLL